MDGWMDKLIRESLTITVTTAVMTIKKMIKDVLANIPVR